MVALYTAAVGGLFYYNMFKFVFDQKLQNEMAEMVRFRAPLLVSSLASRPLGEATFREAELMKEWKRTDDRIKNLVYLNANLSIRWHENTKFFQMSYEDYLNEVGMDSNAVFKARNTASPQAVMFDEGNYYDMAIPLLAKDNTIAGIINLTVSRVGAKSLIRQSMFRYAVGSLIMLVLIGLVLYFFLFSKIIRPLNSLKDSIDAVSLNQLDLAYQSRSDEIGEVADSVASLLAKIKEDIKSLENVEIMSLEKERRWWKTILAVAVPHGSRALVIDENNNILYTNFEMNIKKEGPVHLLDIFDGRQQNIIQVVGEAMEHQGKVLRGNVTSHNVKFLVKAVQLPDDAGKNRIVLVLEPEKSL